MTEHSDPDALRQARFFLDGLTALDGVPVRAEGLPWPKIDGRRAFLAWAESRGTTDRDWWLLLLAAGHYMPVLLPDRRGEETAAAPQRAAHIDVGVRLQANQSGLIEDISSAADALGRLGQAS